MRKNIILIFILILSIVMTVPLFAQVTSFAEQIENQYKRDLDEMNKDINPIEFYTFDNCMPVYNYEDFFGNNYDETFASHISDEFYWETAGEKWTKVFYKKDSVWKEGSSATMPDFFDKDRKKIDVSFSLNWFANKALEVFDKDISDFKIVSFENKYMIYFVSEGTEYIIPFDTRSDLSGIENGKLYTADEIIKNINTSSSGISISDMPEDEFITYGGSVGNNDTKSEIITAGANLQKTEFPYWIIGVIVGVIAIAAVTVIVIKKKKA